MARANETGDDPLGPDDNEILEALRQTAAKIEPVGPEVLEAARAAFTWRRIDEELAELVADSARDQDLAGVRGTDGVRLLTFEVSGGVVVELEVAHEGAGLRVLGQLVPSRPGEACISHRRGAASSTIDALGRFAIRNVAAGPVRIELRFGDSAPHVVTDPVLL